MQDGISIIICCYNSAWIIKRCLIALQTQQVKPDLKWEILLIDNKCTDNTVEIAKRTMKSSAVPFRIIKEEKAGLAYARRTGINNIQFRFVIYCDDDNLLCPTYVQTVYNMMAADDSLGAVGGRGIAEFCTEPEPYVLEHLGGYAVGSQAKNTNLQALWGAGLTLRTKIVQEVYNTQRCYLVGRKEGQLLSGDDTELVLNMIARGYNIKGTDEVSYIHVLPAHRLTEKYCKKMQEGFRIAGPVLVIMRNVLSNEKYWNSVLYERYKYGKDILFNVTRLLFRRPFAFQNMREIYFFHKYFSYWGVIRLSQVYWQMQRIKKIAETKTSL